MLKLNASSLKFPAYRGRLAPSPTGYLHLGHARTFWTAQERARDHAGTLVLRNEDLDRARSRAEFVSAIYDDLRWFGFNWQEGPDIGGPFGPYSQSERQQFYVAAFQKLRAGGFVYPCACSRHDVLRALQAPHVGEEDPVYPGTCRPGTEGESRLPVQKAQGTRMNWRFQVPDGEIVEFEDVKLGPQKFVAGKDFGDFIVWRQDDLPSYQLAVVVDDTSMQISEVVRGEDLLLSTARQLLLYRALGLNPPRFYHCPLMTDAAGVRLAKRHAALSLRTLRVNGNTPEHVRRDWQPNSAERRT